MSAHDQELGVQLTDFDVHLRSGGMSQSDVNLFGQMKFVMVTMRNTLLVNGRLSTDLQSALQIMTLARWIMTSLKQCHNRVQQEVKAIESVLELAPFTIRPSPETSWTNYKQMAELIIKRTKLPSNQVLESLHRLYHVYSACVYHPVVATCRSHSTDFIHADLLDILDNLCDKILNLIDCYQQWVKTMEQVGTQYTKPVLRQMTKSPQVMKDILVYEAQKEAVVRSGPEQSNAVQLLLGTRAMNNTRRQPPPQREVTALR